MSNLLDTDAGSELFTSYEAEFKLVQADLSQKLDQIAEQSGEPRKSAIRLAERSLEEANELVSTYAGKRSFSVLALAASISRFHSLTTAESSNTCYSSIKCVLKKPTSPPLLAPK